MRTFTACVLACTACGVTSCAPRTHRGAYDRTPAELRAAYEQGRADAKRDLLQGKLVCEAYGLFSPSQEEYEQILKAKYGVELRWVGGCMVEPEAGEHARGYNEVSQPEIKRRFGQDLWERTEKEADEARRAKYR